MIEIEAGSFVLNQGVVSWHGIFSFIAVGAAVFLVGRWAPSRGVDPDDFYSKGAKAFPWIPTSKGFDFENVTKKSDF